MRQWASLLWAELIWADTNTDTTASAGAGYKTPEEGDTDHVLRGPEPRLAAAEAEHGGEPPQHDLQQRQQPRHHRHRSGQTQGI